MRLCQYKLVGANSHTGFPRQVTPQLLAGRCKGLHWEAYCACGWQGGLWKWGPVALGSSNRFLEVLVFFPECVTLLLFSVMKVCEQLDFKAVFGEYLTIHSLSTRALPKGPGCVDMEAAQALKDFGLKRLRTSAVRGCWDPVELMYQHRLGLVTIVQTNILERCPSLCLMWYWLSWLIILLTKPQSPESKLRKK